MRKDSFVPFWNVELNDGFWKDRYDLNKNVSLESVRARFEESGRMDALRFNYHKNAKRPHHFYDSDVAKWIEGVAYVMEKDRASMADFEVVIDELVDCMEKAQREDGYLNSFHQQIEPENIFKIRDRHELYCAGHLIEAAVAYYHATGKDKLLRIMERVCDCIYEAFFEKKTAAFFTPGHEEIELALYRLYECTGKERYREMAEGFLTRRGHDGIANTLERSQTYAQDEVNIYEVSEAMGHSVRALYLYCGVADMARYTGDERLLASMKRVWQDMVDRKMYVTGGFGSTYCYEGFTYAYDLPNGAAYSESCAAIAMALFAMRMRRLERNAAYGDVIERELYNNGLSSTSLSGKAFFYENPLEIRVQDKLLKNTFNRNRHIHVPISERVEVFNCSCCPPNINRFFAFFPELICVDGDEACIEQYIPATVKTSHGTIRLEGDYAVSGKMTVSATDYKAGHLLLRMPAWSEKVDITCNGEAIQTVIEDGYIRVDVEERFTLVLDFHIKPRLVASNPNVAANAGRAALCYGPVVYCLEAVDNGDNLNRISIDRDAAERASVFADFHGICSIETEGYRMTDAKALYFSLADIQQEAVSLKWIPYYAFANRGASDMLVWVRVR